MAPTSIATNCHQEKQPRELATVATIATNLVYTNRAPNCAPSTP